MVAKAGVLTLTLNQYKDLYRSKYDDAKKINARNEELQGVLSAYSIAKDTIYLEKIITAAGVDSFAPYRSKWIDIDVILQPPSVAYEKRDSFDIYHNVVQKSLFWGLIKFGQKTESYNIVSYDDKSKILGFRVIKLIR